MAHHHDSTTGPGPRRSLNRADRRLWAAQVNTQRRAGACTALHAEVGRALARRLGTDGRCDPSHDTIAADAGCSPRTVRRALDRLRDCGLVAWQRRVTRDGWRTEQTSNAYELLFSDQAPTRIRTFACGGQRGRGTSSTGILPLNPPSGDGAEEARKALMKLAAMRQDAIARQWASRTRQSAARTA